MRKLTLSVTKRADGRVCKRIDGRLRIWADLEAARKEIINLIALREGQGAAASATQPGPQAGISIRTVLNLFLEDREARMIDGRITKGTFLKYKDAIESFAAGVDNWKPAQDDSLFLMKRECPVGLLTPAHFRHIRSQQARGRGACSLDVRIQCVRTGFRWAWEVARLIASPPHYGDDYHKPTKADKRADKRAGEDDRGEHRFTPRELGKLLKSPKLTGAIKAMVWLSLNSGMYAADCAELRWSDVRKEGKPWVVDTYREKTQVRQKFVLWAETKAAMDVWRALCPKAKADLPMDLVFVTRHGGAWVHETIRRDKNGRVEGGSNINSVSLIFNKLLHSLGIKRQGVGFGAFRHTHVSAAARHPDMNARMVVRGHKIEGIESHYDYQNLSVLKSVTDLVYQSLIVPALKCSQAAKTRRQSPGPSQTADRRSRVGKRA